MGGISAVTRASRHLDGRGEFHGDDSHEGQPIQTRFIWSNITDATARWEQAYSRDQGRTWVDNWIMELIKRHS